MTKRIVLFDADVLAYRAAAAAEERKIEVTHLSSGKSKIFKNRTKFKEFLNEQEFEYVPEHYQITDMQIPEDVSHPLSVLKKQIANISEALWADEYKLYISGSNNFRDTLPLPSKYKGKRTDQLKPLLLKSCREYLINYHKANVVNNHETDDALIYEGYHYLSEGYEVILVTNDKDANAYSHLNIYDYTDVNPQCKLIPDFGSLRWDENSKKVKGEGFIWYCAQALNGDPVDNYKPTELTKVKFGDASVYKLLREAKTHQEALMMIIAKYKEWYPEEFEYTDWRGKTIRSNWQHMLNLYHSCARMMEKPNDPLIAFNFYKRFGVDLE